MPAKRLPRRKDWFRVRCVLSGCLTVGVWTGVLKLAGLRTMEHRTGVRSGPAGTIPPAEAVAASPVFPPVRGGPAIIIDPGHGGRDPGKPAGDQLEKSWALQVSLALAEELRARGWPVELTRTEDIYLAPGERSDLANRAQRRALVSIHFNSGGPDANGLEVLFAWPKSPETLARLDADLAAPANTSVRDDRGRLLAEALQSAACAATGSKSRGAKNDPSLAVLNRTRCPAVLVECGFLTNAAECQNIQSDEWRGKLVRGLTNGLESWLEAAQTPGYGVTFEPDAGVAVSVSSGAAR